LCFDITAWEIFAAFFCRSPLKLFRDLPNFY
jgi:hypothetical protein